MARGWHGDRAGHAAAARQRRGGRPSGRVGKKLGRIGKKMASIAAGPARHQNLDIYRTAKMTQAVENVLKSERQKRLDRVTAAWMKLKKNRR